MKIQCYTVGSISTHCYFLIQEETKEIVIVDPGAQADLIQARVEKENFIPKAIFLTHGHGDHILAVEELQKAYEIPVYAHENEKEMLEKGEVNLSTQLFGTATTLWKVDYIKDGTVLEVAGFSFQVIHTPGHTQGGCCYYEKEANILMSGDTLFQGCIGRTDLPGGNTLQLVSVIKEKLMVLPMDVKVYPGHGETTTIKEEKAYNPYLGRR